MSHGKYRMRGLISAIQAMYISRPMVGGYVRLKTVGIKVFVVSGARLKEDRRQMTLSTSPYPPCSVCGKDADVKCLWCESHYCAAHIEGHLKEHEEK
jgi:hypothetical protein